MQTVIEVISWILLLAGSFFYLTGSIGLLRMPDVFSRMHAASVADTVGASLLLLGMMVQAGLSLVTIKLVILLALILFTGPVATHALARAARYAKVEPLVAGASVDSLSADEVVKSVAASVSKPKSKAKSKKQTTRRKPVKKGRK